jgi:septum formation protein
MVADVDERLLPGEPGEAAARRLACLKAESITAHDGLPVLGADTLVVSSGKVLGKPSGPAEARAMLRELAGRMHAVVTALCLAHGGRSQSAVEVTRVSFAPMSAAEIDWYVGTGEPLDKAGAYHIDGLGALFVASIDGSPSNVAGLPITCLRALAQALTVDIGLPRGER